MQIIHPSRHKAVAVAVAAIASFFGFQASSLAIASYQIENFFAIVFFVYLFLVFWQTFVFDLHLRHFLNELGRRFAFLTKKHHFLHFQNYLILPGIIYWTTIALLYLAPFDRIVKQALIAGSTLALGASFWYFKTVFYSHREAGVLKKHLIFLVKLYASYLAFAASLGALRYFGYDAFWFSLTIFAVSFLLFYQALFQHHYVDFKNLKSLLGAGILLSAIGYAVYLLWNVNYYSGALVLAAVYNTIWGIIHHQIDRNLTREVVYEYLAVLFVILVILFSTTNFAQRI